MLVFGGHIEYVFIFLVAELLFRYLIASSGEVTEEGLLNNVRVDG